MFNWKNVFRGAAMGITELVPGVSASTIAMLLGIYEKLLQAISDLTTGHIKRAFRFLVPLGIGMVAAVALFVKIIEYLLHVHNQPMMFLFAGLVLGILPFLWRSAHAETKHSFKPLHYVLMIGAFVLIAMTSFVGESNQAVMENLSLPDYIYLFFSGWLASTALVLPGISGSLVFLILGVYHTAIAALSTINIPVIITIGCGVVLGLLVTSRLVRFFLKTYTQATYSLMIGLVAGSLIVIVPTELPGTFLYWLVSIMALLFGLVTALTFGKAER
ncbi:DUF368 domain-containing protein [Shouchella clausii]|uniref:DUF368 domain-containing protein n=1 Tax=Shouchella clausii TaxID=79880 RepID=UPI002148D33D|nr:DUF368 domain-containing protein [Shouchella clausii]MCR1287760.1 DUF368 domain-containing protein [Shouchella clausii]